ARTVGKAALAARHGRSRETALGIRGAGPIPRRVAALLGPPRAMRTIPALATATVLGTAIWSISEAAQDLHMLLRFIGA
ncbi:hypothetical protein, partial [Actinoallomurus acaciae]